MAAKQPAIGCKAHYTCEHHTGTLSSQSLLLPEIRVNLQEMKGLGCLLRDVSSTDHEVEQFYSEADRPSGQHPSASLWEKLSVKET